MKYFVDSNVLLYGYDTADGAKYRVAGDCLRSLWTTGGGVTSVQVLKEFFANATRPGGLMSPTEARLVVTTYLGWPVQPLAAPDIPRAATLQERHRLSFWDALILLAATQLEADILLTEDLNHGQVIEGVRVHNPFLGEPLPS